MLTVADLFSGIGGISLALNDYARPVLFCEVDPFCRRVLVSAMNKLLLRAAPILQDVRSIDFVDVDMVTAGFPCQNLSLCGNRAGLDGEKSGLFYEIVRIVELSRPKCVFLENVTRILATKDIDRVVEAFKRLKYDMIWGAFPAYIVGSPQRRSRWFCLCVRRDVDAKTLFHRVGLPQICAEWIYPDDPSERLTTVKQPNCCHRGRALGNCVVPQCAKFAFEFLVDGVKRKNSLEVTDDAKSRFAYSPADGPTIRYLSPAFPAPDLGIVLIPKVFPKSAFTSSTTPELETEVHRKMWPTARTQTVRPSWSLTERSSHDLTTAILFEKRTIVDVGEKCKVHVKLSWLENMMGYPAGYTLVPKQTKK